ncbi:hypothetical protein FOPE_10875 [Fonsecaea pedrosoi]|nr:hypothetical protein FOPE_10875 [Fonsecaea pedrosoi]
MSEYFEQQNAKNITRVHNIRLDHVLIGNGWYDPLIQHQAYYYSFSVSPGNTYDYDPLNETVKEYLWNIMNDWNDAHYLNYYKASDDRLRRQVQEA